MHLTQRQGKEDHSQVGASVEFSEAQIEELLLCELDAYEATGPPLEGGGQKWALQRSVVAPVGRSWMDKQYRGHRRAKWREASKKVAAKGTRSYGQAVQEDTKGVLLV